MIILLIKNHNYYSDNGRLLTMIIVESIEIKLLFEGLRLSDLLLVH